MIKTNWHTHTTRCGHAVGTDEEYVKAAIKAGLHTLGFSDHAPYREPFPPERMNFEQLEEYMSENRFAIIEQAKSINVMKNFMK